MTTTFVTRSKFQLKLTIFPEAAAAEGDVGIPTFPGDETSASEPMVFECISHNSTFAMNRIPLASCTIAVGRNVRTLQAALIHQKANQLKNMLRAKVTLIPSGRWSASQRGRGDNADNGFWDQAGPQTIFDGYLTGVGYKKLRGQLHIVLHLIHWLSDLAFSSIFSDQSHPANPADLTFRTVHRIAAAGTVGGRPAFMARTRFKKFFTPGILKKDVWEALGNSFCEIAQQDLIQVGNPVNCGGVRSKNDHALAALARIEGTHSCNTVGAKWHVPLSLAGLGTQGGLVAKAMAKYVGDQSVEAWWSTTVWGKLVHDLASTFMFHIVPRVETALIVPFVPGLQETWQVTIPVEDLLQLHITSYIRRPLRGVGVFSGRDARTVNNATDPDVDSIYTFVGIGGCFLPDPEAKGQMILKRAPGWLSTVPDYARSVSNTALGREEGQAVRETGSATTPQVAVVGLEKKAQVAISTGELYDNLAHYLYMLEILRGRNGMLATKLRFDIAPGSTIFIENVGEQFISAQLNASGAGDLASPDIYATVMSVSIGLSAEAGKASTVLQLGHIRTRSENADIKTSTVSHPMYSGVKFKGAPLVDEYLFN